MSDPTKKTLGPADLPQPAPEITYVDVPCWGGRVGLCSPSSARCDQVQVQASVDAGDSPADDASPAQKRAYQAAAMSNFHARTVALCLCNEDGTPWYDDAIHGADLLGQRPGDAPTIKRLYETAKALCPLTSDAVGALEKNSDPPEGNGSSGNCESPARSA